MHTFDPHFSRRSFLTGTAAALAAAAIYPAAARAAAPEKTPSKKLGFAVVGIGTLAKGEVLPGLMQSKYCKPVAMVTGHPDQNAPLAGRYGIEAKNIYTYDKFDDIAKNPDIDVVYIVLPNNMHPEFTIRAAKAGKHVLCEKPMATNVADCEAMIAACKTARKQLMIAYRQQYEPLTRQCVQIARDQNTMGKLLEITGESGFQVGPRSTPENYWRLNKKMAGGGSLMDMGIYAVQAARYLSGEEPTSISAVSFTPPNNPQFSQVEQTMNLQLTFPSGLIASILTSYGFSCNRARVNGQRAVLDLEPLQHYTGNQAFLTVRGRRRELTYTPVHHFANEADAFALAITNNQPIMTPGEEGLRDLKILTAAFDAASTGKTIKLA